MLTKVIELLKKSEVDEALNVLESFVTNSKHDLSQHRSVDREDLFDVDPDSAYEWGLDDGEKYALRDFIK